MKKTFRDTRELMEKYNTIDTALKSDAELLMVSDNIKNKAIYCHQFIISTKTIDSLNRNGNCVIGIWVSIFN